MTLARLRAWLRTQLAEPVETWHVQFEAGGQTYTYRRTAQAFTREMQDRYQIRGTLPHSVQVVRNGHLVDVEFDTRAMD